MPWKFLREPAVRRFCQKKAGEGEPLLAWQLIWHGLGSDFNLEPVLPERRELSP